MQKCATMLHKKTRQWSAQIQDSTAQKYSTTAQCEVMGRVVLPSCRRATIIEPQALSPPLLLVLLPILKLVQLVCFWRCSNSHEIWGHICIGQQQSNWIGENWIPQWRKRLIPVSDQSLFTSKILLIAETGQETQYGYRLAIGTKIYGHHNCNMYLSQQNIDLKHTHKNWNLSEVKIYWTNCVTRIWNAFLMIFFQSLSPCLIAIQSPFWFLQVGWKCYWGFFTIIFLWVDLNSCFLLLF